VATASERLWRTGDGRLVRDGDPDGQYLEYPAGATIAPKDEHLVPGGQDDTKPVPAVKAAAKPADKQATKPADK
jgi:hypothetical protein